MQQQQNNQQNQQAVMPQPPKVMSTKDHLYMTDMLSWNLLAMKKMNFYANQCTIPEVKNALTQAGQMHHRHYQMILQQLQELASQPMMGQSTGQQNMANQQNMSNQQNMQQQ